MGVVYMPELGMSPEKTIGSKDTVAVRVGGIRGTMSRTAGTTIEVRTVGVEEHPAP
jgi:hypothetical protein